MRVLPQRGRSSNSAIAAAVSAIARGLIGRQAHSPFGNGGSATDATDWALDCVIPEGAGRPIPAVSLALEPAVLTAIANDVGVDVMFLRQLIAQARPHDVVIAFSTSGGSRNVVAALEEARKRDMLTIALLGYDGGEIVRRELADIAVVVRCDYIPRIQEAQGTIYHVLREALAEWPMSLELFGTHRVRIPPSSAQNCNGTARRFVEYDVDEDAQARTRICARQRAANVPVLVEDGQVVQVG